MDGGLNLDESDDDDNGAYGGPPSVGGASSNSSRPTSPMESLHTLNHPALSPRSPAPLRQDMMDMANKDLDDDPARELDDAIPASNVDHFNPDQTTLLPNEEEGFALAPVDTTTVKGQFPPASPSDDFHWNFFDEI